MKWNSYKSWLEILSFAIIIAFLFSLFVYIFTELFLANNIGAIQGFYGAFAGAFFAFLFIRLSDALTRIYERKANHYRALVKIELNLNQCLVVIASNLFTIVDFRHAMERGQQSPNGIALHVMQFEKIPFTGELVPSLTNIDFMNDLHIYTENIRKINRQIMSLEDAYQTAKLGMIDGKINRDTYYRNVGHVLEGMSIIEKFLKSADDETVKTLASTRVLAQDKPFLAKLVSAITKTRYGENFLEKRQIEEKNLHREREEIRTKSEERIKSILQ